jgi:hypothetical protein
MWTGGLPSGGFRGKSGFRRFMLGCPPCKAVSCVVRSMNRFREPRDWRPRALNGKPGAFVGRGASHAKARRANARLGHPKRPGCGGPRRNGVGDSSLSLPPCEESVGGVRFGNPGGAGGETASSVVAAPSVHTKPGPRESVRAKGSPDNLRSICAETGRARTGFLSSEPRKNPCSGKAAPNPFAPWGLSFRRC